MFLMAAWDWKMEELFVVILSMLLFAALVPLYLWKRRQDSRSLDENEEHEVCLLLFFSLP
jgi:hypothetical protein